MHHKPRRERAYHRDPTRPSPAHPRPREGQRKRAEDENRPEDVSDVERQPRKRRSQERHRGRAEERLGDLRRSPARVWGRDLRLLYRDETLVIEMGPAVLESHLRGCEVGVKVHADRVVADGQVKDQRERDEAEGRRQGNPVFADLYTTEQSPPSYLETTPAAPTVA